MEGDLDRSAFESAVARLPHPVFVVHDRSMLRPINDAARDLLHRERLDEQLVRAQPHHPLARLITAIGVETAAARKEDRPGDDSDPLTLTLSSVRYEVIYSHPSPQGAGRWLMLILRPLPAKHEVDPVEIRKRWSLTPREAEIAAASISGQTSVEICEAFSIARETLKTHMRRILDKTGCESRGQLTSRYFVDSPRGE